MQRLVVLVFAVCVLAVTAASAQQWTVAYPPPATPRMIVVAPPPPPMRSDLGGGFIQYLFGDAEHRPVAVAPPPVVYPPPPGYASMPPPDQMPPDPMLERRPPGFRMDPRFLRQEVAYTGKEPPGAIVVDTPHHFLYLVEAGGKAMRYGIGVARSGFSWSGTHKITAKKEWPDWIPPKEMLERQPYLPRRMAGGPDNPLGARALYIGHTLYRIHGTSEPWTIGHNVSSGCIRMRNVDIIDLYKRVGIGTTVVVLGPHGSDRDYIPPPNANPNNVERAG
jgi:lipoprotein-anchoring transpeptidase ErfK/SrfK